MYKTNEISDVEAILLRNNMERKWRDKIKADCRKERERIKKERQYQLKREVEAVLARGAYILCGTCLAFFIIASALGSFLLIVLSAVFEVLFAAIAMGLDRGVRNGKT